jgi:hypothetical protein
MLRELPPLDAGTSAYHLIPQAINEHGQIAGVWGVPSVDVPSGDKRVFVYTSGEMRDLGDFRNEYPVSVLRINDQGQILVSVPGRNWQCVLITDGESRSLGYLTSWGYPRCVPTDMNNSGVVVGSSGSIGGPPDNPRIRAFVYVDGAMLPINDLISTEARSRGDIYFTDALRINDHGEIIALGDNGSGTLRGYLLRPVSTASPVQDGTPAPSPAPATAPTATPAPQPTPDPKPVMTPITEPPSASAIAPPLQTSDPSSTAAPPSSGTEANKAIEGSNGGAFNSFLLALLLGFASIHHAVRSSRRCPFRLRIQLG